MDLNLTKKQKMMVKAARDFLEQECAQKEMRQMMESPQGYSPDMWRRIAKLGWTGIVYPKQYGGLGLKNLDATLLMKEMGRAAFPSPFLTAVLLCGRAILAVGSEAQKEKCLPKIASGDLLISFALVEANALPNAETVETTARLEGGAYVLNGTKWFVEFAEQSDYLLVVARTRASENPEEGLTMFLVDSKMPGISYSKLSTMARQPQAKVKLEDVRLSLESVVGPVDGAWPILESVMQSATAILCGYLVGLGAQAHELAVAYCKERIQFERPIGSFQVIQGYLATSWTELLTAEYLSYYAAWQLDEGLPARYAVSVAKSFAGYAAKNGTQLSTQLHGGMGATAESPPMPFLLWAKQLEQTLGTCEYHERIVAEEMLEKEPIRLDETEALALT